MSTYVTGKYDDSDNSYSRQATIEASKDKMQKYITDDPDLNEQQRQNMRDYRDLQNSENNPNHEREPFARGGCVTARGAATLAKLRARHGKDV